MQGRFAQPSCWWQGRSAFPRRMCKRLARPPWWVPMKGWPVQRRGRLQRWSQTRLCHRTLGTGHRRARCFRPETTFRSPTMPPAALKALLQASKVLEVDQPPTREAEPRLTPDAWYAVLVAGFDWRGSAGVTESCSFTAACRPGNDRCSCSRWRRPLRASPWPQPYRRGRLPLVQGQSRDPRTSRRPDGVQ